MEPKLKELILNNVMVKYCSKYESEKEWEAKVKMWTKAGISIYMLPAYSTKSRPDSWEYHGFYRIRPEWITAYQELQTNTVAVRQSDSEYQFRFGSPKAKAMFINMFRVPR